jgi:transcriptional regulator with XRE-family HTH domain
MLWSAQEITHALATRVRQLRLERGWTQKELAERAGISSATYQLFEQTGQIALERLVNISIALSRTGEIENLFSPMPIRSVDELAPKPQRQRGRRRL